MPRKTKFSSYEGPLITEKKPPRSLYMKETAFWNVVAYTFHKSEGYYEAQEEILFEYLLKFKSEEIIEFHNTLLALVEGANNWDLWGCASFVSGSTSAEGFYEFRVWLLAQGKDVFYGVLKDPNQLALAFDLTETPPWILTPAHLDWAPLNAYYEKTGTELTGSSHFTPKLPEGIPPSENVIAQKFPKLALNWPFNDSVDSLAH
jgi:hypothetical protein